MRSLPLSVRREAFCLAFCLTRGGAALGGGGLSRAALARWVVGAAARGGLLARRWIGGVVRAALARRIVSAAARGGLLARRIVSAAARGRSLARGVLRAARRAALLRHPTLRRGARARRGLARASPPCPAARLVLRGFANVVDHVGIRPACSLSAPTCVRALFGAEARASSNLSRCRPLPQRLAVFGRALLGHVRIASITRAAVPRDLPFRSQ
jgi:hypothetical protein